MNINKNILKFIDILNDLENLSKKLYYESPETWLDFQSKVGVQNLDEMVLFYATKYNYLSVLKYALDNNIIDLELPSKNNNFKTIKDHLLAVAKNYHSDDVYNFLKEYYNMSDDKSNTQKDKNVEANDTPNNKDENVEAKPEKTENNKQDKESLNKNNYYPTFICPHCNSNIFKSGYKVYEEICFQFSNDTNNLEETTRQEDSRVFCKNCNNSINDVTPEFLKSICSLHNCHECGKDLTKVGIDQKVKLIFNNDSNNFSKQEKIYVCHNCNKELTKNQIKYFNL